MGFSAVVGRTSDAIAARAGAVDWPFIRRSTPWLVPAGFFLMTTAVVWKFVSSPAWIGIDASLYAAASAAWIAGSDPWAVTEVGVFYSAPPPTLLAFVPFIWMPPLAVSIVWILGSFGLAWLAIRSLGLPIWWMAFPPVVDGALAGNPDITVLALLVVGGGRLAALAPFFKIYAVVPMIGERRWRQIGLTIGLLAATILVLPSGMWFAELPDITRHLADTSRTTSVYGRPILMAIAAMALLALGTRRAGWLAVPLLWPSTQLHYGAIAVPGLTPYLALAWCVPLPEVWLASTCAAALYRYVVSRNRPPVGLIDHDGGAKAASWSGGPYV